MRVGEAATGIGERDDTTRASRSSARRTRPRRCRRAPSAIDELTSTGALEDFTAGDQTQLDRELAQISASSQVDDELAKLKAEVGAGDGAEGDRAPATPSLRPPRPEPQQ